MNSDQREAPHQGQELWHLAALRLSLRHPQHVQGVPRAQPNRRRRLPVPGHGRPPPCPLWLHSRMPYPRTQLTKASKLMDLDSPCCRNRKRREHPPSLHQAAPHQGPQLPSAPPRSSHQGQDLHLPAPNHFRISGAVCCLLGRVMRICGSMIDCVMAIALMLLPKIKQ
jgi:hypothetical protein